MLLRKMSLGMVVKCLFLLLIACGFERGEFKSIANYMDIGMFPHISQDSTSNSQQAISMVIRMHPLIG